MLRLLLDAVLLDVGLDGLVVAGRADQRRRRQRGRRGGRRGGPLGGGAKAIWLLTNPGGGPGGGPGCIPAGGRGGGPGGTGVTQGKVCAGFCCATAGQPCDITSGVVAIPACSANACANSLHVANLSRGSLDIGFISTGSTGASSPRRVLTLGAGAWRCWLMTATGLDSRNGDSPVNRRNAVAANAYIDRHARRRGRPSVVRAPSMPPSRWRGWWPSIR